MPLHRSVRLSLIALAGVLLSCLCHAQEASGTYPKRPVNLVVTFPAGSGADVIARIVSKGMESVAGQPFVVINRPGASGAIAAQAVKRAEPDGYTLLVGTGSTMSALWALKPNLPFDTLRDFVPITPVGYTHYLLMVNPSVPATTVPELIAYLKKNPGKLNYGSGGYGGIPHLLAEMFKQLSGTDMNHVPYQGTIQATNGAIAGDVQVTFDQLSSKHFVDSGHLRALGVSGLTRSPFAPDVPPIADALPGFEGSSWLALFAPAGTPEQVIEQLRAYWVQASALPGVQAGLATVANSTMATSTDELVGLIKSEAERWRQVGKTAGIVLD